MKKFLIKLGAYSVVGTLITVVLLNLIDNFLYKISQSSYLEVATYRTNTELELAEEDVITLPEGAELVQFSYNNKYYAYLKDNEIHINTIEDNQEHAVVEGKNPICYYYMLFDKNLILYFEKKTTGNSNTLSLKTYEIATNRTIEYNDFNVNNFSKIKDITMSPLINIIYVNVETKTLTSTNNIVYKIDLFNSMSQVRSGVLLDRIKMLQHVDRLYYQDTKGGVYNGGATINYLFGYADVDLIGIDIDEKLYLLNTTKNDRVYVVDKGRLVDTIYLSDTDIVTTFNEYDGVYLIYPTYIMNVAGKNPYKRLAKLSKYVTFETIKGDTVYLRTSNNKIITTTLLENKGDK